MSKYIQSGLTGYSPETVLADLGIQMKEMGDAIGNAETVSAMVGAESIESALGTSATLDSASKQVDAMLDQAGVPQMLAAHLGFNPESAEEMAKAARHPSFIAGMNAAVITASAAAAPAEYMATLAAPTQGKSGVPVQSMNIAGIDVNEDAGIEAFDKLELDDFLAQAIVSNTLTAATDGWEEGFFQTVVLPAGNDGVDVTVGIPQVYQQQNHAQSGAKYKLNKQPITRALYDHTVLATNSAIVYPVAIAANNDYLVPVGQVGNWSQEQAGAAIDTRPLVFGKDIDLLGVSTHAGIHGTDVQDATDSLHSSASLGDVFVAVTHNANTQVMKFSTAGMKGSMFVRHPEGREQELVLNFRGSLVIRHDMTDVAGANLNTVALHTPLGVALGTAFQMEMDVQISGTLNRETGNIMLQSDFVGWEALVTGANDAEVGATERTDVENDVTVDLIGFYPDAARSVSNMRGKHLVMEAATNDTYRLQIQPGSPIVAVKPVAGKGGAASLDQLTMARRVKNSNDAVTALLAYEQQLANGSTLVSNSTTVGSTLVSPTYRQVTWDAAARTVINRTGDGLSDLVGSLANAVTMLATQLIQGSNYLSALKLMTGSTAGYQVIVGVDERIAAILQRAGDDRTLFNQNFRISANADERVRGRIYVSLRRTNMANKADPLSFGTHLSQMPLIYNAQFAGSGTSVVSKQQLTPYDSYYMMLPVLGRIDITNLDNLFYS